MTDVQEDTARSSEAELSEHDLAAKAAFARLGIELGDGNGMDRDAFVASLNAAADRLEAAEAELKTVSAERDKLKKAVPAATRTKAPKARKAAPIELKDGEFGPSAEELLQQVNKAKEVEIVFSDGKQEIVDIPAIGVTGDHPWMITGGRLKLVLNDLTVNGPADAGESYDIDGYGLLLDGKLAAYGKRMDVAHVGANQQISLKDDVVF